MFSSFHIFIRRRHPTKVDVWGRKSFFSISLSLLQLSHNTVLNHIIIHCLARELFLALISLHAATERGHGNGNFSSHMTTLRMGSHYEIMKKKTKEKFQFPWEREGVKKLIRVMAKIECQGKEDKNEKFSSSSHQRDEKWVRLWNMWHAKETFESQSRLE